MVEQIEFEVEVEREMTLRELVEYIGKAGGHIKGRGDGTIYWEDEL